MVSATTLTQLYPTYVQSVTLEGLYLQHALHHAELQQLPLVYTNFIASLDGRIAIDYPGADRHEIPRSIVNQRDLRLYQELGAQADVLITSARYVRDLFQGKVLNILPLSDEARYHDLHEWRKAQGMVPQPAAVIISSSLNLPAHALRDKFQRPVYIATGEQADPHRVKELQACGVPVLFAGKGREVEGRALIEVLAAEGFYSIYSVAGPQVLETLVKAGVVNRFYLTQVHRLIGGKSYDTLFEGQLLEPPADFLLKALYYDLGLDKTCGQFFAIYDETDDCKES